MDYRMLITYVIVDIFCIIIVGVIQNNLSADTGSELEIKTFKRSLWSYILFMVAGLIGLIMENSVFLYLKPVDYAANIISLSCLGLSSFFWFMYVQLQVNRRFVATRWRFFAYLPILVVIAICVSSPWTKWAFYINENNDYMRGPLFAVVSGIPLLYDIASSFTAYYRALKEKQASKRQHYRNLGAFIYFPFIASILQIVLSGMPILAPAIATSYFMVFVAAQKNMIYNDSLTGLNNRRHAMIYMEEKIAGISEANPLTLLMLDGDRFKTINDTYGHLEGDTAIGCMAEAIRRLCTKYKLFGARYGGDEFLMIKFGDHDWDAQTLGAELNAILQQICEEEQKKYVLSMTMGCYTTVDNREDTDRIIRMADEDLYRKKSERKMERTA